MASDQKENVAEQQSWIWTDKKPPGPQTAVAGSRWTFRLPVSGPAPAPPCHWSSPMLKEGEYSLSDDQLTLSLEVPADAKGVNKIHFRLDAEPPIEGFVLLKIIPKSQFRADPLEAKKDPVSFKNEASDGGGVSSRLDSRTEPAALNSDVPGVAADDDIQKPDPLPEGTYFIAVYRDQIPIRQLRTRIESHKSLLVGKFSRSKQIFPDIDLKAHFQSKDREKRCSREQARIFMKDERVLIRNLGKSDISISGNTDLETGGAHFWALGEKIEIPGGLTLILEKEG